MRSLPAVVIGASLALIVACGGGSADTRESTFFDPVVDSGDDPGMAIEGGIEVPDAGPACTPRSCAQQGIDCGPTGDGCGGVLQCGTCTAPQTCGGGGTPSKCGGAFGCVPKTSADCPANGCGIIADGCGGSVTCGTCTAPDTCGGGGTPGKCGQPPCTPRTCAAIGAKACGPQGDGCGGVVQCGGCTGSEICGGDPATPGQCGVPPRPDGGAGWSCTPKTCANFPANACGKQSDGCGGLTPDCGTCTAPQTCGGGGATPGVCSGNLGCVAKTAADCAAAGIQCGPMSDGCGGTVQCGGCRSGEVCGSPTRPSVCSTPPSCTPKTCAQLGMNCGFAGDGCGGLLNCGGSSCPSGQFCGGGGNNVCGTGLSAGDAGVFVSCAGGVTTRLTGKVVVGTDPSRFASSVTPDPVPNAVVYVPSGAITPFAQGAVCDTCAAPAGALTLTQTAFDGTFTLNNVPSGPSVPIVVQLGKWRRVKRINVTACANNVIDIAGDNAPGVFRLPRSLADGDSGTSIPRFGIRTGKVDGIECVLRKMGLTDDQFGNGGSNRLVEMYRLNGASFDAATTSGLDRFDTAGGLSSYDVLLLPCAGRHRDGSTEDYTPAQLRNLVDYANAGGRVFASHFSYNAIYANYTRITPQDPKYGWGNAPVATIVGGAWDATSPNTSNTTAIWDVFGPNGNQPQVKLCNNVDCTSAQIDESFAKGAAFASWLRLPSVGAGTLLANGTTVVDITEPRWDFRSVVNGQRWMFVDGRSSDWPLHYTFNTPVNAPASKQCGRVVYSDFHVNLRSGNTDTKTFPDECGDVNGKLLPLTAQEKVIEYMLLDLSSCISQDSPPACVPKTCAQLGASCGRQGNGCGGQIDCGTCPGTQTCGGGGVPNQCGGGSCVPKTCAAYPNACGRQSDGCGGLTASCGACSGPACTPKTCAAYPNSCGAQSDGCGGVTAVCGTCVWPQTCGGGGVANQCGVPDGGGCQPKTCQQLGIQCGPAGDGCGNLIASCGTCPPGQTCGGGGVPGVCGGSCTPRTCAQQNIECGPAGDGCGGVLACGDCTAPLTCGGGGVPGKCGAPKCTPRTCAQQSVECGPAGDGCGALLNCGECVNGLTCGGGGVPGKCGRPGDPR